MMKRSWIRNSRDARMRDIVKHTLILADLVFLSSAAGRRKHRVRAKPRVEIPRRIHVR